MPFYQYDCPKCHHNFEKLVKIPTTEVTCPKCYAIADKQMSAPSFILKGKGFYSSGSFLNSKKGPKRDTEFDRLSDRDQNIELGLPEDCGI